MTVFGDIPIPLVKRLLPRLKERAELLYSPPIDVQVELVARDRDGNVTGRRKFRSHSFVSNFIQYLYAALDNPAQTSITTGKDINGTVRTFSSAGLNNLSSPNPMAGTGANIVVGTSSTAPAFGDYVLGGFAGRVHASLGAPIQAATSKFTATGTISFVAATTINEVGIDAPLVWGSAIGYAAAFLFVHDNVSGGFAVSAGGSITVTYTISVTT